MFMSALCESCQQIVSAINAVAVREAAFRDRVIVVMRANESACRAFQRLFPLEVPLVADSERELIQQFSIRKIPSALLYDARGVLVRSGMVLTVEELLALIGEPPASGTAQSDALTHSAILNSKPLIDERLLDSEE